MFSSDKKKNFMPLKLNYKWALFDVETISCGFPSESQRPSKSKRRKREKKATESLIKRARRRSNET